MDWLAFTAQIVSAIAWPAVVVVLLFLLRPHFAGLATRLQNLKLPGGAEAQFRDELAKAAELVLTPGAAELVLTPGADRELENLQLQNDQFQALSSTFPEAAVMYSFQEVERVLDEVAQKLGLRQGSPRLVINTLQRKELIDRQLYELYNRLSTLRNIAVHKGGVDLTQDEALEYRSLATTATAQFRKVLERM